MNNRLKKTVSVILFLAISIFISAQPAVKAPDFKRSNQIFSESNGNWEATVEDLNGDSYLDLVITSIGTETAVFFNDGKGLFSKSKQLFQPELHGIAVGDLDNDGDKDLFFTALRKNQSSPVYLNDGKGVFQKFNIAAPIESGEVVKLTDIDNDGDLDAYLLWGESLYLNDGKGNFTKSRTNLPGYNFFDLNGDGFIDNIGAVPGEGFKIFLNDKKGNFPEYYFLPKKDLSFCYLGFADLDNDKDIDIIFSNGTDEEIYPAGILLNDGTCRFTDSGQKLSKAAFGYIGTGDLNLDGFIDIIITDMLNPAKIWMNTGNGKFIDSGITLGEGGFWNNCIVKDFDNDGDLDVFITKARDGNCGLWLNQLKENKQLRK